MARPVVASAMGRLSELVAHGEMGFLVPARDFGRLRDAIQLLCEDRALAHRLGLAGRQFVETHHARDVFYRGLRDAYRELGA